MVVGDWSGDGRTLQIHSACTGSETGEAEDAFAGAAVSRLPIIPQLFQDPAFDKEKLTGKGPLESKLTVSQSLD